MANGVTVDSEKYTLSVPDIGVTLRTLLAVASKAQTTTKRRTWNIVYKDVVIGSVRIKTILKGEENGKSSSRGSQNRRGNASTNEHTGNNLAVSEKQSTQHGKNSQRKPANRSESSRILPEPFAITQDGNSVGDNSSAE